ncbi:hypothetical protein PITCH_A1300002 [uncultured Desulfobacterium sp.]|uniref:FAD/NAD(P)-binding domain-containing protein n=1 Tax=uncultured Desulfobacterium sp. TaxID=201089 RepID=A0A445MSG7_9BACT|nr:hypothetical protein PITCH_A1300002 [uncultured Desulfobacterium sp.]
MPQKGLKILIIGGVACGPKAASRVKRLLPNADVTIIEKGNIISYGACGLPYYVEGFFNKIGILTETPIGIARTPVFFEKVKGVVVLVRTEALGNLKILISRFMAYYNIIKRQRSRTL